jgi:hypothetical protein
MTPAPRPLGPTRYAPPPTVGAWQAVPVFSAESAPYVGAQFIAPSSPRLPILPPATNSSPPRHAPTPTVSLTLLSATLTKNAGVPVEP